MAGLDKPTNTFYNKIISKKLTIISSVWKTYNIKMAKTLDHYTILEKLGGHVKNSGRTAGSIKNPIYKVLENGQELYIMCLDGETLCVLCEESYKKILEYEKEKNDDKKITFYIANNYIAGNTANDGYLYIHQIIMNCYKNGKGTMNVSVDHIDRNPLNNTISNLRVANRETQQQNSIGQLPGTKRKRNNHAQDLPEGLTQEMIPKHVTYMTNIYNKEKELSREYFRIENHPRLRLHDGCKSGKKTIFEKLEEIKKIVDDLDLGTLPMTQKEKTGLPPYIRFKEKDDKAWLIYEKRTTDKRQSIKMSLPENYVVADQLILLLKKIEEKYPSS